MSHCVPDGGHSRRQARRAALWRGVVSAACIVGLPGIASAQGESATGAAVPDLAGFWTHSVAAIDYESPPDGGPGPVQNTYSFTGQYAVWVGDHQNPILQPWAAEAVKEIGELELQSKGPPTAQMVCKPSGVPNAHTLMGPMHFLQTSDVVLIVHQRDHQVRRVYMGQKHTEAPEPSWYGESVGHYEGDTLVVDTIGLNAMTVTDRNGTPHTEAIHVIERYRVTDGGNTMEVRFTVEDPNAFTTAWSAMVRYQRDPEQNELEEMICAENNRLAASAVSIPVDENPDF